MKKSIALFLGISPIVALGSLSFGSIGRGSITGFYAEENDDEKTLYVDFSLNGVFKDKSVSSLVKYNDGENKTASLSLVSDDIYCFVLPESFLESSLSSFSFSCIVELDGGDAREYRSEPIQGGGLLVKDNYNYVRLAEYIEFVPASIEGYGYYGEKTPNPGATYETQRIWLADGFKDQNDVLDSVNAVGYYSAEKWNVVLMDSIINSDNSTYYYADIPMDIVSISFLNMATTEKHDFQVYEEIEVGTLAYGVCYAIEAKKAAVHEVVGSDAMLLSKIVEAYLTYGDSPSNGSIKATVIRLYQTWFAKKTATTADLKGIKILDYTGYTSNGNSYEGLIKQSQFSVNEKWNGLCSQAGIDPYTGKAGSYFVSLGDVSGKNIFLLTIVSVGFVALLGLLSFFARRYILTR